MEPWSLAVPDWRERIRTGRSLLPDLPHLDQAQANRAVAIFNKLRLPDVIGTPALAEAGADWFREIVGALHGSFDPASRERMIREIFLLAPKKSSKTSYAAALMVTTLLMNERPRAEFLLVAPTVSLAHIAFSQALGMVDKDPDGFLRKRLHVQEHLRKITDRRTKATLEIKAFDTTVLTGVKPTGVLLDELHEIAKVAAAERIIGQLRGGLLPNPEGFLVFITTQSDEPPRGAFRAELMVARAIRDGKTRGAMLPVLYEFPEDIANDTADPPAWQDSSKWWMVTPNRDRSVTIKRLEDDWAQAKAKGQGEIIRWASQHLNIEIGLALRSDRWVGADLWQRAADKTLTLDVLLERSEVVVIGIDGGGLDDLLGLAVLGRDRITRHWLLWSKAWAHGSVLERRKSEASVLRDFETAGELRIVRNLGDDIAEIAALAERIDESGKLGSVGLDPFGVGAIVDALAEVGIAGNDRVVGITQGWKLTGAIKTAERKLADGTLVHGGTGLMAWAVGNAKVEPKGNAIVITKQASGTAKIDPLMAEPIYQYAAPPFAFGAIDDVVPFAFVIDTGVDALSLGAHEGKALLMVAAPLDPTAIVSTPAPPYPFGDVDSYSPLSFSWQGATRTIYPAATIGRSSLPGDTPANTYVPAKLTGAINFGVSLFSGADPVTAGSTGIGVLEFTDPDGELDYMMDYNWDNAPIYLRRGEPAANFADWELVASLTGAGILANPQKKELRLRDQGWRLRNAELHGLRYGGTGGADGDAHLAGIIKPYCVGYVFNITPVAIGATLLCYQVSCSSIAAVTAVRDGGSPLSAGADYTTYPLLAAATVAPGTYATCLAQGLFRLGSSPVNGVTCDVTGDADVIDGQNGPTTRGQIARRIVTRMGAVRLNDATQIDFPALAAFASRQPAPVGWYWNAPINKADALDEVMRGCLGWWCVRLNGLFSLGQIEDPALVSPTLILSFPAAGVGERRVGEPQMTDWLPPRRATYIGFRQNYTVQGQSQLATGVSQADAAIYGAPVRFSTAFDQWTANAYPGAVVVYIANTGYRDQADSDAEAARQARLLMVPRYRYSVPVVMDPLADAVGRNTRIDNFNRLGFGAARQFWCCGVNATAGPYLQVDVWG